MNEEGHKGDKEKILGMYNKVLGQIQTVDKVSIVCPECRKQIPIVNPLSKMNKVIEDHIQAHKKTMGSNNALKEAKIIGIRLELAKQTIQSLQN